MLKASNKPVARNASQMSKSSNVKLTYGREHLAIPGPSNIPQRVLQAMNRPAPNIYGKEIELVTEGVREGIAKFANTNGKTIIYVSNGHGVWEASLVNLFRPNDSVLLCSTGHFGYKWGIIAKRLGLNIIHIDVGFNTIIDPTQIEEILKNDRAQKIKGILVVHTDTSSSSRNRIQDFKEAISAAKHPAILVVDAIASFGCERIEMDPWGIDVLITASQKGLMTPPGLAYCIVNERAENYSKKLNNKDQIVSPYWDWQPRLNPARFYDIFSGTAPTNLLFGQLEALNMLNEEGRENIFLRHEILSGMVWECIEHLGSKGGALSLNIRDKSLRSNAVTTIFSEQFDFSRVREWISRQGGVDLGIGIGFSSEEFLEGRSVFRIGHMGYLNPHMILGVLSLLEAGLEKENIPFTPGGITAATEFMVKKLRSQKD